MRHSPGLRPTQHRCQENESHPVRFTRRDIADAAKRLGIEVPKNLGDVVYSFRYRKPLPATIRRRATKDKHWIIRPAGRSAYVFALVDMPHIVANRALAKTKVPDATPGIIAMYSLNDEQALLAKIRYNRLLDVFTGVACYSLQSHLRTAVAGMGQVETDELYVGLSRAGVHFILPVQVKGRRDKISVVQVEQDLAMCEAKFPGLVCWPVCAQSMEDDLIAMFVLERRSEGVRISCERHYRLVSPEALSAEELAA